MLKAIIFSLLVTQGSPFLQRITSDFSEHSCFLVISMKGSGCDKKYVIENDDLFVIMNKHFGINKKKYKHRVESILKEEKCFSIKELVTLDQHFRAVNILLLSDLNNQNNEKSKFIDHYFKDRVFRTGFSEEEVVAVIAQLFEWEIPCKIDDETGVLTLD